MGYGVLFVPSVTCLCWKTTYSVTQSYSSCLFTIEQAIYCCIIRNVTTNMAQHLDVKITQLADVSPCSLNNSVSLIMSRRLVCGYQCILLDHVTVLCVGIRAFCWTTWLCVVCRCQWRWRAVEILCFRCWQCPGICCWFYVCSGNISWWQQTIGQQILLYNSVQLCL